MMSISADKDPMDPSNWNFPDGPIFERNNEEDVYTTGHAAFTVSPGIILHYIFYLIYFQCYIFRWN
jgi:GH43 family beta-xylosidase